LIFVRVYWLLQSVDWYAARRHCVQRADCVQAVTAGWRGLGAAIALRPQAEKLRLRKNMKHQTAQAKYLWKENGASNGGINGGSIRRRRRGSSVVALIYSFLLSTEAIAVL